MTSKQFQSSVRHQRRSSPHWCHPVVIFVFVVSLGLTLIGLVMTLVFHGPFQSVGDYSERPLLIASPSILGAGGAAFVLGLVLVGVLGCRQRTNSVTKANSYPSGQNSTDKLETTAVAAAKRMRPLKSCLKNSSTSTLSGVSRTSLDSFDEAISRAVISVNPAGRGYSSESSRVDWDGSSSTDDVNRRTSPVRPRRKRRFQMKRHETRGEISSIASSVTCSAGKADIGINGFNVLPYIRVPPSKTSSVRHLAFANTSFVDDSSMSVGTENRRRGVTAKRRLVNDFRTSKPPTVDPIRNPIDISRNQRFIDVGVAQCVNDSDVRATSSVAMASHRRRTVRPPNVYREDAESLESDV